MATLAYPNLARDSSVRDDFVKKDVPLITRTRNERKVLSDQWLRYTNIWNGRHDQQGYRGRTNVYLKTGRRIIENWVTKLKQDLFPVSGQWTQISTSTVGGEEQVSTLDSLMRRYLAQAATRRKFSPWLRTLVTLGTAPLDIGWKHHEVEVPILKAMMDRGKQTSVEEVLHKVVKYLGPTIRLVSPYRFYVYPASVNDLGDTTLQFEDFLLSMDELERLSKMLISEADPSLGHHVENLAALKKLVPKAGAKNNDDRFEAQKRLLAARGLTSPVDNPDDPNQMVCVTKVYRYCQLDPESDEGDQWYQLLIGCEDTILQARRVPFWTGESSYLCGKFVEVEEEFYGYGVPSVIDGLQYLTNDIMNQGSDALTWSINPIAGVDPFMVQDPTSIRMKPGAKWLVRNPRQSIQFMEPPKESAVTAQSAVQQMIALMNDVANVSPYGGAGAVGRSRGRAVSTATGMQLVASEALVQVTDVIQTTEDLVMNPMLRRFYDLTQQCLEQPLAIRVEGARGAAFIQREITREDVIGDFDFQWTASKSSYNQQVLAQQLVGAIQIAARIPPEVFAQQNKRINVTAMFEALWTLGFQLPNVDRIVESITPVRSLDPGLENELLSAGRIEEVVVSPADDNRQHITVHADLMNDPRTDEATKHAAAQHIQQHIAAEMAKQLMAQQQAQMQAAGGMGMPGGMPGMPGGGGGLLPASASGSGDLAMPSAPGRIASTTSQADVTRTLPRGNGAMPGGMGGSL